jgi:fatty acid amide hydrolase 2
MTELLELSALEIARRIRAGELRSRDVTEAHIRRVEAVNPTLNAVVRSRFDAARADADAADAVLAEGGQPTGPLHGVPCTIKESFALTGMPNSAGLVSRREHLSDRDASTVARLRQAGAIPLGVTNTSELCMWMESHNQLYGRTRNPYDHGRIVGGSSGGEGAIVGAGASPFGLGSDIGGSIRMPAFFNGVFGHKPSMGIIPNSGQYPVPDTEDMMQLLGSGPICRRAEDLMPLVRVLAGPDGEDPICRDHALGDPDRVDIGALRVISIESNGFRGVSGDLRRRQHEAAEALGRAGAQVRTERVPELRGSLAIWANRMSSGGPSYATLLGEGTAVSPLRHLVLSALGRSPHTLPSIGLAIFEEIPFLARKNDPKAEAAGRRLRQRFDDLLGDDGVILYPSYTRPAPRHNAPILTPLDWTYTAVINALGLPATQVPLGLNADGIPLGVQVVGPWGADHITIAVARELERAFGGWTPPWTSANPRAAR